MTECCQHHYEPGHAPHRLQVAGLCVNYGHFEALCQISFETTCGHSLALLGPNGAGKSTLIRALAGLQPLSKGEILWKGSRLKGSTREIAYLPQLDRHPVGFPVTVRDVVAMGRLPHVGFWKTMRAIDEQKVDEALAQMHLENLSRRPIDALSGGQRQRAFLARALAQEAHILLLDEPFAGLDVESSLELAETMKALAQNGHLVMASHHDLATVESLFDEALVLRKHQIAFGQVSAVLEKVEVRAVLGLDRLRSQEGTHVGLA